MIYTISSASLLLTQFYATVYYYTHFLINILNAHAPFNVHYSPNNYVNSLKSIMVPTFNWGFFFQSILAFSWFEYARVFFYTP